jgi:ubiquinone/menaquinone biosynthesis C-methylase UbiE
MNSHTTQSNIIHAWDDLSEYYQKTVRISTRDIHYGLLAHGENQLSLLGHVKGKRVLEVGCGGGQNTIALARKGAEAVGVDPAHSQIIYAQNLAVTCNSTAHFAVASAVDLPFNNEHFHVVLTSYAFDFVEDIKKAFEEVYKVLKREGIFILCLSHPYFNAVIACLTGEEPEPRTYVSWPETITWNWESQEESIQMWSYNRTLSQIVNPLVEQGFILEKIVEQGIEDVASMSEEEKSTIPYVSGWNEKEYLFLQRLPCTFIVKFKKTIKITQ